MWARTRKNVDVLNLTKKSRLCSHHFNKEEIRTDDYTSSGPVYFAWNNQRKPEKAQICNVPDD